jgi:hypothetical protein
MYFHLYLRLFKGGGYNLKSILPFWNLRQKRDHVGKAI